MIPKKHFFGSGSSTASDLVALAALATLWTAPGCSDRAQDNVGRPWDHIQLQVKDQALDVEVSNDNSSRQLGLMNRKEMPESSGMLFLFPALKQQSFWMKNTLIDLSIAFLGDDGKILEIADMKAHDESHTQSKSQVRHALEVNKGWFQKHGIGVGDSFADFHTKIAKFVVR